jgi:aminoglycoside phosphotransferase (APT) family kinase protein
MPEPMVTAPMAHPRRSIYYWKCDRPAAFHGTGLVRDSSAVEDQLGVVLRRHFPGKSLTLRSAGGQGNHVTFVANLDGWEIFVRVEDGPEQDDYMEVESRVLTDVRALGVPAPRVHAVDASRAEVPFAWQVMDLIAAPDLNELHRQGRLDLERTGHEIGRAMARWQAIQPGGFGPFDPEMLRSEDRLTGYHATYRDYFHLHLDRHLCFLIERGFLQQGEADQMAAEIAGHDALLAVPQGCLVHKDLALWNILGTETEIAAYIDWDDAISGDPMDDLSLLGCFHGGPVLVRALAGYCSVRPLPDEHRRRFWLHLLRNMVVKAVIRVGAGYFDRGNGFYLIGAGSSGADLKTFTSDRLAAALRGLRENRPIDTL